MLRNTIRTILGLIVGLLAISVIAEGIEFALVTILNGEVTVEPREYFAIRNRPWVLCLKLVYNTLAAAAGGYLAVRIVGKASSRAGILLAVLQTVSFAWAVSQPELRKWAPLWFWGALTLVSISGIICGAMLARRQLVKKKDSKEMESR